MSPKWTTWRYGECCVSERRALVWYRSSALTLGPSGGWRVFFWEPDA